MPTDTAGAQAVVGPEQDLIQTTPPHLSPAADKRGLRLALGAAASFALALLLGWPMANFSAVFVVLFLQGPAPMPPSALWKLVQVGFVFLSASWLLASMLAVYTVPFLIAVAMAVSMSFYWATRGAGTLAVVLALMAALMIPNLVLTSRELALTLVIWVPGNLVIAWLWTVFMFHVFPPDPLPKGAEKGAGGVEPGRLVLRMSFVTIPFAMLFFLSGSGMLVTLFFVALLSMQLAAATGAGPVVAKGMLKANAIGGIAAIVAYEVTVIAPLMLVAMVVMTVVALALARWFVSDRADASLAGTALSTLIILFGGSIAPFGDDADVQMLDRLYQIGFALAFVLIAYLVVDSFFPLRRDPDRKPGGLRRLTRKGRAAQRAQP